MEQIKEDISNLFPIAILKLKLYCYVLTNTNLFLQNTLVYLNTS